MKKCMYVLLCVLFLASCDKEQNLHLTVNNNSSLVRNQETVEIAWNEVKTRIPDATAENVVVMEGVNIEVPSQVIIRDGAPQKLIFQVTLQPETSKEYRIKTGTRSEYKSKAFGRHVPERMDDLAWENNLGAYRMYGPALENTGEISNGIDVWVKSTEDLVIDDWYKKNDYHRDHGQGFDGYKVGRTLGAGAMAPYVDDKLVLGNNFTTHEVLDNGPIRTTFKLTYAPYGVGEGEVNEVRLISLDANNHFNRIEEYYENAPEGMQVAAGIVLRDEEGEFLMNPAEGLAGYWEPQNNDNNVNNGHMAIGLIFPQGAKEVVQNEGHLLAVADYVAGKPCVYYMGSAWSKAHVNSAEEWFDLMRDQRIKLTTPLKVAINN
ncbi:MAG: DUF4861 domain-containing protein [Odoribacter sp.]|nr:DUF4861 domain-containing protein [Odoribacter sp.]